MKNSHQLFLAFFIPFSAALLLLTLGFHIFPDWNKQNTGICFDCDMSTPLEQQIYGWLIISLFLLSFIMPPFVRSRNELLDNNEIKLNINGK